VKACQGAPYNRPGDVGSGYAAYSKPTGRKVKGHLMGCQQSCCLYPNLITVAQARRAQPVGPYLQVWMDGRSAGGSTDGKAAQLLRCYCASMYHPQCHFCVPQMTHPGCNGVMPQEVLQAVWGAFCALIPGGTKCRSLAGPFCVSMPKNTSGYRSAMPIAVLRPESRIHTLLQICCFYTVEVLHMSGGCRRRLRIILTYATCRVADKQ
jgi:hypothetical protein